MQNMISLDYIPLHCYCTCIYILCFYAARAHLFIHEPLQFELLSVRPPVFRLTVTTRGGPPTIAQWAAPFSDPITDDNTTLELLDGLYGFFQHNLTLTGNTPGFYNFVADNPQNPSQVSDSIVLQGESEVRTLFYIM